jgi:hypothetical protein
MTIQADYICLTYIVAIETAIHAHCWPSFVLYISAFRLHRKILSCQIALSCYSSFPDVSTKTGISPVSSLPNGLGFPMALQGIGNK